MNTTRRRARCWTCRRVILVARWREPDDGDDAECMTCLGATPADYLLEAKLAREHEERATAADGRTDWS